MANTDYNFNVFKTLCSTTPITLCGGSSTSTTLQNASGAGGSGVRNIRFPTYFVPADHRSELSTDSHVDPDYTGSTYNENNYLLLTESKLAATGKYFLVASSPNGNGAQGFSVRTGSSTRSDVLFYSGYAAANSSSVSWTIPRGNTTTVRKATVISQAFRCSSTSSSGYYAPTILSIDTYSNRWVVNVYYSSSSYARYFPIMIYAGY